MTTVVSPSNVLPHSQRLRLIRSIRKLGDLLTETSHMVDAVPSLPVQHSRSPSMAYPSELSPRLAVEITSEEAGTHSSLLTPSPTSPHARTFFSIRLPKSLTGDHSPLSPTFSLAFSLNSPSTPVVDPETLKERKLAKVVQTLGENVPPELVFPLPTRGKGRKRASTMSVPEYASTAALDKRTLAAGATVVGRRRHARETSRTALKHAASSTSLRAPSLPTEGPNEPFSYPSLLPVSAFEASDRDVQLPSAAEPTIEPGMRRKEAGWSGEWSGSVRNMDDVVRGLRDLRLK